MIRMPIRRKFWGRDGGIRKMKKFVIRPRGSAKKVTLNEEQTFVIWWIIYQELP